MCYRGPGKFVFVFQPFGKIRLSLVGSIEAASSGEFATVCREGAEPLSRRT
jgi:hypothetical protein